MNTSRRDLSFIIIKYISTWENRYKKKFNRFKSHKRVRPHKVLNVWLSVYLRHKSLIS